MTQGLIRLLCRDVDHLTYKALISVPRVVAAVVTLLVHASVPRIEERDGMASAAAYHYEVAAAAIPIYKGDDQKKIIDDKYVKKKKK